MHSAIVFIFLVSICFVVSLPARPSSSASIDESKRQWGTTCSYWRWSKCKGQKKLSLQDEESNKPYPYEIMMQAIRAMKMRQELKQIQQQNRDKNILERGITDNKAARESKNTDTIMNSAYGLLFNGRE